MTILKQSTAVTIKLGPFVDDADGKTAETALTISQADIRLSKNGGDIAQTNNSAGATHDKLGYYDVPLDATDTNTLGRLRVMVSKAGALPVWQDFLVVTANVFDSLFSTDKLDVNVAEMLADVVNEIQSGLALEATITEIGSDVDVIKASTATGSVAVEYPVLDSVTDAPLYRVHVWVSTDMAGSSVVRSGYTNTAGTVTFYLEPGTYYFWCSKDGYFFNNPDTEIIS